MMLEGDFAVDITIRDEGIVLQYRYAVVAQLAEQLIRNEQVAGSTPVNGSSWAVKETLVVNVGFFCP